MESANPFAQMPATPEPIIAQLRRQLGEDDNAIRLSPAALDHLADRVVRDLWDSPIKTFVPVLALRDAREVLHAQQAAAPGPEAADR